MDNWLIIDKIKRGIISYNVGDEVFLFHRKGNGSPRSIEYNVPYKIYKIEDDGHLLVLKPDNVSISSFGPAVTYPIKVHKKYMISRLELRQIRIDYIL